MKELYHVYSTMNCLQTETSSVLRRHARIVRANKRRYLIHYCIDKKALARWCEAADSLLQVQESQGRDLLKYRKGVLIKGRVSKRPTAILRQCHRIVHFP